MDACEIVDSDSGSPASSQASNMDVGCDKTTQLLRNVIEYEWPLGSEKYHFIEEYLVDYLGIRFMRKAYPSITRRRVQELDEREYLKDKDMVTDLQCDLGVMAIPAEEVYRTIAPHYKVAFERYLMQEWKKGYEQTVREYKEGQEEAKKSTFDLEAMRKAAVASCAKWNAANNKRIFLKAKRGFLESQTGSPENGQPGPSDLLSTPVVGHFPVSVVNGHFVDSVPTYSSPQMKCLPLNTVLTGPEFRPENACESGFSDTDTAASDSDMSHSSDNFGDTEDVSAESDCETVVSYDGTDSERNKTGAICNRNGICADLGNHVGCLRLSEDDISTSCSSNSVELTTDEDSDFDEPL